MMRVMALVVLGGLMATNSFGQTLQKGADPKAKGVKRVRFDYLDFRPARYERSDKVFEPQDEQPNKGGLVRLYYTNVSDQPTNLSFWRLNGEDESFWKMSPGLAWSRQLGKALAPGQSGVLEINGTSEDFSEGKRFDFLWVERGSFIPVGLTKNTLREDPVQISFIGVRPGLAELIVHVRYTGEKPIALTGAECVGRKGTSVEWKGESLAGPGHAIARIRLAEPLTPMEVFFVRVSVQEEGATREVWGHRRAHADQFAIGTWGIGPESYQQLKQHHISMGMMSGRREDDFFARDADRFDLQAMVGAKYHDVDSLRSIGDHPRAAVLYLADEPDWTTPPSRILHDDEIARHFNPHKPTLVTLCRNVQFFEFAPIVDIPCQDHYSVSAPTSSKWPTLYGTRLEETGIYTRDLRRAAEPKPVWVWSQGLFDWDERPQHPLPTADELAFQLWQNVGQGAKGILWFTFRQNVGDKYPATREEIRRCGRLLRVMGEDLVVSDPVSLRTEGPSPLEVLPLLGPDRLYLILTNGQYKIHPKAYQWTPLPQVQLRVSLPSWIQAGSVTSLSVDGAEPIPFSTESGTVRLELGEIKAWRIVLIDPDGTAADRVRADLARVLADESKTYP
jgi:hypothetical protein